MAKVFTLGFYGRAATVEHTNRGAGPPREREPGLGYALGRVGDTPYRVARVRVLGAERCGAVV